MARYNPVCEVCNSRPKMDRCVCCEECWYNGAYSEWVEYKSMTPKQRRIYDMERMAPHGYHEVGDYF